MASVIAHSGIVGGNAINLTNIGASASAGGVSAEFSLSQGGGGAGGLTGVRAGFVTSLIVAIITTGNGRAAWFGSGVAATINFDTSLWFVTSDRTVLAVDGIKSGLSGAGSGVSAIAGDVSAAVGGSTIKSADV